MLKHRSSTKNYTMLATVFLPISIYLLQLLGKVSFVATCIAGILVFVKVAIEWHNNHQRAAHRRQVTPLVQLSRRQFVQPGQIHRQAQAPIAGCYLCGEQRPLVELKVQQQRLGVCANCYRCAQKTKHRI